MALVGAHQRDGNPNTHSITGHSSSLLRTISFRELVQEWESAGIVAQWNAPIVVLNKGSSRPASDTRQRFVGVPGMNAMARHLAEEMHVVLNKRITRCERRDNLWHLFDERDTLSWCV